MVMELIARGSEVEAASAAAGAQLWSRFWRDFGPSDAPQERCYIPGDGREAVDLHWAQVADALRDGAQVIDLGCGTGIVGATLLRRRSALRVTGVDWAAVPAAHAIANLNIRPGVRMESLPFDDASFDAAVSLFGIEYGAIDRIAPELRRVLRPGAPFSFLIHHADSEILREGSLRRRAVRELLSGPMKAGFLAGDPVAIDRQRQALRARYAGEPSVQLFADYLRRHSDRARRERQALWQKLEQDFGPEVALLHQLERSAKSAKAMGAWLAPLLATMAWVGVDVLRRRSGEPIAWRVHGQR
jgi:SAM-dependent methyltransferase